MEVDLINLQYKDVEINIQLTEEKLFKRAVLNKLNGNFSIDVFNK
jgi:hypothetical protein